MAGLPIVGRYNFAVVGQLPVCRQPLPNGFTAELPVTRASSRLRQRFAVRCYRLHRHESDAGPCDPCVRIRSMDSMGFTADEEPRRELFWVISSGGRDLGVG